MNKHLYRRIAMALSVLLVLSAAVSGARAMEVQAAESAPVVRIVIDAGHGGTGETDETELGAVYNGLYEKDLTLVIAALLGEELSAYGNVQVYYTRTSDVAMSLKERADYAASVNADYFISIHLNASSNHDYYGSEVFTSAFGTYCYEGTLLGNSILNSLGSLGFASKGVKTRIGSSGNDYYGVINRCRSYGITSIIVEHGYVDNDVDWSRMDSPEELSLLAQADAAGIAAYLGLQKGVTLSALSIPTAQIADVQISAPDVTAPADVWYTVNSSGSGSANVTIHAAENESSLMYYGYSLDNGASWQPLELWGEGETITVTIPLGGSETSDLAVKVINSYELSTAAERR